MKTKTFKRLLEEEKNTKIQRSWEEVWILGCHQSYVKQSLNTNCPTKLKELKLWWKGCLRKYNKKK